MGCDPLADGCYLRGFATLGLWFVLGGIRSVDALRRVVIDRAVYKDVAAMTCPQRPNQVEC